MNLKTKINAKSKFRIHTLTGDFEFDDLFNSWVGVYDDKNFYPELNSVGDLTDI
jgi:hypothetical protein